MTKTRYLLLFALLASVCVTLATVLQPRTLTWSERAQADSVLKVLLGDGRRIFANHFFVQADVYFHSGYYPSIFDRRGGTKQSPMVSGQVEHHDDEAPGQEDHAEHHHDGEADHDEAAHEKEMSFLDKPRDWIEAFGRHFFVTDHTHLEGGDEREILPWLKLSAELDPQRVDTYVVAAYWLRTHLGKLAEAEAFLREGLRNNPNNPELLFELGRLNHENAKNNVRARDIWELALRRWQETEGVGKEPNLFLYEKIVLSLGRMEEDEGHFDLAIQYLQMAAKASPHPEALQQQIEDIRKKQAGAAAQPIAQ